MNKRRVALLLIVIAAAVLIGVLLNVFVPSLLQIILDMHRGL